ncbi:acetyl-CoA carboxylase biotin carboxyl carrier protein [Actinomadura sp. SCN-SB]|uniref:acetyl-CoA carboxylase biotin carboxyl carrier protein n=1 Tax=Actinomadura sp. SCN-SB TaxID=3373092 RepID=UPI003751DBA4
MDLTHDDVRLILDLVDEHEDIEFLELRLGDLHLVADRTGTGGHSPPAAVPRASGPGPVAVAEPDPSAGSAAAPAGAAENVEVVTAPVVGVFFAAPEPGAPPYVEVGGRVEAEDTVGLIEVMKMFNGVQAGVRGEVVRILVANEEFVEFGQPLMEIRPEAGE